ncbi:MAG: CDP-diacylglycerol--glycerol-3-phosphate 3-phosphatidyltransferase [Planctomycetes bacterium]|nr:CDP-diacylglycerol--glycerol-3-phosphate 3-phosphatidyltransferase [Planctomycetota bacterium]
MSAASPSPHWLNLPNRITLARLLIAVLLFFMLTLQFDSDWASSQRLTLNLATIVFVICVATDWLDGYLARRYGMITVFGRIADPFVDKVVVCGACIYLVKIAPELIKPWFAAVLVAREFLVTSLRGFIESRGVAFGARLGGKVKMVLQSITLPVAMCFQANFAILPPDDSVRIATYWTAWTLVVATLLATLISAWDYVVFARVALKSEGAETRS